MVKERKVGHDTVAEDSYCLLARSRNSSKRIAGRIEDQCATFRQRVRVDSELCWSGKTQHKSPGRLVDIGLHPRDPSRRKELLRVASVTVKTLRRQPMIEVVPTRQAIRPRLSHAVACPGLPNLW